MTRLILLVALAWIYFGLLGWFLLDSPATRVANWIWGDAPAPWESVDAFYYPDYPAPDVQTGARGLASVDECRAWVREQAARTGDAYLAHGDYDCRFGDYDDWGGLVLYRRTVK